MCLQPDFLKACRPSRSGSLSSIPSTIAIVSRHTDRNLSNSSSNASPSSFRKTIGYILWIFGFTGSHRFYFGHPISGTIYLFTLGLFFIGWIVDLFLIPGMDRRADLRFREGRIDYNVAWILLTFLGLFGIHRMYMGKWISGILYLLTGGFLGIGVIYDFWTLNDQITIVNTQG
jgi:TM2 domain-containing membrane protein YozV